MIFMADLCCAYLLSIKWQDPLDSPPAPTDLTSLHISLDHFLPLPPFKLRSSDTLSLHFSNKLCFLLWPLIMPFSHPFKFPHIPPWLCTSVRFWISLNQRSDLHYLMKVHLLIHSHFLYLTSLFLCSTFPNFLPFLFSFFIHDLKFQNFMKTENFPCISIFTDKSTVWWEAGS